MPRKKRKRKPKKEKKEDAKEDSKEEKKEDAKEDKKEDAKEDKKEDAKEDKKEDAKEEKKKGDKSKDEKEEKEEKKGDDKEDKKDDEEGEEKKKGEKKEKEVKLSPDPGRSEDENGKPIHETSAYPKRFSRPPRAPPGVMAKQPTNHPALPGYKPPKNTEAEPALSDKMPEKFVDPKATKTPDMEVPILKNELPDAENRNKEDRERIALKKGKG